MNEITPTRSDGAHESTIASLAMSETSSNEHCWMSFSLIASHSPAAEIERLREIESDGGARHQRDGVAADV